MSEAADLLAALRTRGLSVVAVADRLDVSPSGELTDDDRAAIRAKKAALLSLLGAELGQCHRMDEKDATGPVQALPPVHDARDPHATPTASCAACGAVAWRAESRDWRWRWVCGQCRLDVSNEAAESLAPMHDALDPWAKPTGPCAVCGHVRWRVWSHDGGATWQWICNRCRPLVVHNRDGTVWRSDAPSATQGWTPL